MPGTAARRRGSLSAIMLVAGAVLSLGGVATGAHADTVAVPAPPVPEPGVASNPGPQPGGPVPPCHFASLGSTEIRTVFTDRFANWDTSSGSVGLPSVDPSNPCHLYRAVGGGGPSSPNGVSRLVRGDTDGSAVSWHDTYMVPAGPADPMGAESLPVAQVTALATPGDGRVVAVSSGLGVQTAHVVASADSGSTWVARDAGLVPVAVAPHLNSANDGRGTATTAGTILAVAPSDPETQILEAPGDDALHLTTDGGQHWSRLAFGAVHVTVTDVQFDPADARHIFVVVDTDGTLLNTNGSSAILESHDGAQSWSVPAMLQGVNAQSLIVTDRSGGTLYLSTWTFDAAGRRVLTWLRSRDDGASWTGLTPPTVGAVLAVDPRDPSTLVWAGYPSPTQLVVVASTDDFATTPRLVRRFDAPAGSTFGIDRTDWVHLVRGTLTADDHGDFFLSRTVVLDAGGSSQGLIAFRVSALAGSTPSPSPYATSSGASTVSGTPPPPYQSAQPPPTPPASEVATCNLPVSQLPVSVQSGSAGYTAGSITFDGRYLDYAHEDLAPGVIFRIDTKCTPAPPLQLHPQDFPNGTLPVLYELSYAADYHFDDGTVGAILAVGPHGDPRLPSTESPVYAIDPVTAHAVLLFGTLTAQDSANRSRDTSAGDPLFAYDFFRGGLWTIGGASFARPGFQPLAGGPFQTNCMSDFTDVDFGFGSNQLINPAGPVSTWTVGGDGYMYVQTEDDQTVFRVDDRTCQVLDGFRHRQYVESTTENDQMACDPVTYGPGSSLVASGQSFSVLWIRDSRPNTVSAYRIPAGHCPFPTLLQYTGGVNVTAQEKTTLCFVLKAMTAGVQAPLAGMPVGVTLDGADLGQGITDRSGTVCRPATIPSRSGTIRVSAHFGGNDAYLPSTAAAGLVAPASAPDAGHLFSAGLLPTSGGAAPPAAQGGPAPNPGSEPATSVSVQTEAQVQSQSQAQAQSVSQVQPGVMVQRRQQVQVATQQRGAAVQGQYQAVRIRRAGAGPAMAVVAGTLLLGWSWLGRRPRTAVARARAISRRRSQR